MSQKHVSKGVWVQLPPPVPINMPTKLSNKQKEAIQKLEAYLDEPNPPINSVNAFFSVTDHGIKPWKAIENLTETEKIIFSDLLIGHTIQSRIPSPLLEGLILGGLRDYPIQFILIDCLRERGEEWHRKLPLYARIYNLAVQIRQDRTTT